MQQFKINKITKIIQQDEEQTNHVMTRTDQEQLKLRYIYIYIQMNKQRKPNDTQM